MKKISKLLLREIKKMNINFNDINIPKPYIPEELPINLDSVLLNREMFDLITTASNEMGIYKGFLSNTPNSILLISPLLIQEAVLSSKIEGTHATLEDFLNYEAENKMFKIGMTRRLDPQERVNELDSTVVFNKTMLAKEYNQTTSVSSDEYVTEYEDDLYD